MMRAMNWTSLAILTIVAGVAAQSEPRPRARDLGVAPGVFPPGPLNAITDVAGVRVGQVTLTEGDDVRTGVTAILPHPGNLFQAKVPGAVFVGNAFGKLAGSTQVRELGTIETPIVLTNTLSVGTAVAATVAWTLGQPGNEQVRSVNAVVGETNDGGLNDIRQPHVTAAHVEGNAGVWLERRDRDCVAASARPVRRLHARHPRPDELWRRAHDGRSRDREGARTIRVRA
jgi:D-aminopeptidase